MPLLRLIIDISDYAMPLRHFLIRLFSLIFLAAMPPAPFSPPIFHYAA